MAFRRALAGALGAIVSRRRCSIAFWWQNTRQMPNDFVSADSIVDLTQRLVRVPSRAGVDPYEPIAAIVDKWLRAAGIDCKSLQTSGKTVGLCAAIAGGSGDAVYMLNATLDTAGFGNESQWQDAPTSGTIRDWRLCGRGSADSKVGAAIFCHLLGDFARHIAGLRGTLVLLLDLDEHTGGFAGVRRYFAEDSDLPRPEGVFIGYPGNDKIGVGGRGFTRARLMVHGKAAHSGSSREHGVNAVLRAAALSQALAASSLPAEGDGGFPLAPQLTVTAISGGESYAQVPDHCELEIDVRLTPAFDDRAARATVHRVVDAFDREAPEGIAATDIHWQSGWPAYRIPDGTPMLRALSDAAKAQFGRSIPAAVAGPSNIGNFLATLQIPAISGFGVTYHGIHAADEWIEIASILPVYRAYRGALQTLLAMPATRALR